MNQLQHRLRGVKSERALAAKKFSDLKHKAVRIAKQNRAMQERMQSEATELQQHIDSRNEYHERVKALVASNQALEAKLDVAASHQTASAQGAQSIAVLQEKLLRLRKEVSLQDSTIQQTVAHLSQRITTIARHAGAPLPITN